MKNEKYLRDVFWTKEFTGFYNCLPEKVKMKFDYVLGVVRTERILSAKFVKCAW